MKKLLTIAMLAIAVSGRAQDSNTVAGTVPLLDPPKLAITTASVLGPATNTLNIVAPRLEVAGVAVVNLGNKTVQRGETAAEWVLLDPTIKRQVLFRIGVCLVPKLPVEDSLAGIASTVSIVKDSNLESWLTTTQPFNLVGKLVRWSNLYGFVGIVSRVNDLDVSILAGGGVKFW